jgi:hypothetical protein
VDCAASGELPIPPLGLQGCSRHASMRRAALLWPSTSCVNYSRRSFKNTEVRKLPVLTVPGLDARDVVESAGEDSDNGVEQSRLSQKVHICAGCIAEEEAQKA